VARLERANKKRAEEQLEVKRQAEEAALKKQEEKRKFEEEQGVKKRLLEQERKMKEQQEQARMEAEECRRREAERKKQKGEIEQRKAGEEERGKQEEEARREAAANLQAGNEQMAKARDKLAKGDLDGARAARQVALGFYVKAGEDKYKDLKELDKLIDAEAEKKRDAEFFELAKKNAFEQAIKAQARWKEADEKAKLDAIEKLQSVVRRVLTAKKRKIAGALKNWFSVSGDTSPPSIPRINVGLPPPSPAVNRPSTSRDDEERARRALERRLQFLQEHGGSPSLLGELQSELHMTSSSSRPAASPRTAMGPLSVTSEEIEAERSRRAQERREKFMAMNGGDALTQLQNRLSTSASSPLTANSSTAGSPRSSGRLSPSSNFYSTVTPSPVGAPYYSPRSSGHQSPSSNFYSASPAGAPSLSATSGSPRQLGQLLSGVVSPGNNSSQRQYSSAYSTAPRPPSGGAGSGVSSPWAPSPPHSRK
jgi:actin-related protein